VLGSVPDLDPLHAAHAYRIAAEAMTNAVRHANAASVEVRLGTSAPGRAVLTVSDDGCGMPAVVRPGSTGLLAMRNRARTIGGDLTLEEGPGGSGTLVAIEFPVARPAEDAR
jgi:signal transduction histidine kinase